MTDRKNRRDKEVEQLARRRGIATEIDEYGDVSFKKRNGKLVPRDRSNDWGSYVDSQGRIQYYDGWGE